VSNVECSACGSAAKLIRGNYEFVESGLKHVILQDIELVHCDKCGNEDPIIPHVNALMQALARAVVCKPYRLQGREVRFLRTYLGMTGEQFARLLHVDKTTLSKWENDHDPVGEQSDRLIRMYALALGDGLQKEQRHAVESCFPQIHNSRRTVRVCINPSTMAYSYA
jgi:putative zinc finger/helix-turn-helix YgiT family protein